MNLALMSDSCTSGIVGIYISSPDPATVMLIGAGGGGTEFCALTGGVAGGGVGAGAPEIRADGVTAMVFLLICWESVAVARVGGRGSVAVALGFYFSIGFYCLRF